MPAMVIPAKQLAATVGMADRLPQFRWPLRFKFRRLRSLTRKRAVGGHKLVFVWQ
jgi:hypothetical protein